MVNGGLKFFMNRKKPQSHLTKALIILGYWKNFGFWQTTSLTLLGGILGVLFSVPLRRVLLQNPSLPFPEGTAIGNVLKASVKKGAQVKHLLQGSILGGSIVLAQ